MSRESEDDLDKATFKCRADRECPAEILKRLVRVIVGARHVTVLEYAPEGVVQSHR